MKRIAQTDAIFDNIVKHRKRKARGVLKLSIDVKDKVKAVRRAVGRLSRGAISVVDRPQREKYLIRNQQLPKMECLD